MALSQNEEVEDDEDEFFGSQDDETNGEFGDLGAHELAARQDQLENMGYLESYDKHKEDQLQAGFEAGYRETFQASLELGKLLGKSACPPLTRDEDTSRNNNETTKDLDTPCGSSSNPTVVERIRTFLQEFEGKEKKKGNDTQDDLEKLSREIEELMSKELEK